MGKTADSEKFYRGPEHSLLFQENKFIYGEVPELTSKIAKGV